MRFGDAGSLYIFIIIYLYCFAGIQIRTWWNHMIAWYIFMWWYLLETKEHAVKTMFAIWEWLSIWYRYNHGKSSKIFNFKKRIITRIQIRKAWHVITCRVFFDSVFWPFIELNRKPSIYGGIFTFFSMHPGHTGRVCVLLHSHPFKKYSFFITITTHQLLSVTEKDTYTIQVLNDWCFIYWNEHHRNH